MYLEEAEVKEYARKNGTKYKQLHLGTNSKFKKNEKVAVVNKDALEEFKEKYSNPDYVDYIEAENKDLASEKDKVLAEKESVEHDLQKEKEKVEDLNSKLNVAKEEIFKLKEEKEKLTSKLTNAKDVLLTEKDNLENKNKEIIQLQKEHKKDLKEESDKVEKLLASITKLTSEKAKLEKENDFLKNRSLLSRIINKQYKKEEEDVPELVEAEFNSTSEE